MILPFIRVNYMTCGWLLVQDAKVLVYDAENQLHLSLSLVWRRGWGGAGHLVGMDTGEPITYIRSNLHIFFISLPNIVSTLTTR